jgi:hypothetical protein
MDMADWSSALASIQPLTDWSALPLDMPALFALAAGLGWAAGLRLYALVFVLGVLGRFGVLTLPAGLHVLAHPVVIGAAGLMLIMEFFADKLPWLDSVWDAVHTFIRIPAGAALAAALLGADGGVTSLALGLLGAATAAGTHFAKAGTRALLNTSPEPVSNVAASFSEDAIFAFGFWALIQHPLWFLAGLVVFLTLGGFVIWLAWRLIRRLFKSPFASN